MSDPTATVYVLIWNSRSETAEVIGAFTSPGSAMACANDIESTRASVRPRPPLAWVYTSAEEDGDEREHWVAECGVCDQYEVHTLDVRS